jgi:hypothetical protein
MWVCCSVFSGLLDAVDSGITNALALDRVPGVARFAGISSKIAIIISVDLCIVALALGAGIVGYKSIRVGVAESVTAKITNAFALIVECLVRAAAGKSTGRAFALAQIAVEMSLVTGTVTGLLQQANTVGVIIGVNSPVCGVGQVDSSAINIFDQAFTVGGVQKVKMWVRCSSCCSLRDTVNIGITHAITNVQVWNFVGSSTIT